MTVGVGGKTPEQALAGLSNMVAGMGPIGLDEYQARIAKAQGLMRDRGIAAIYLNAGSNLRYFTGVKWSPSERMVGAVLPADGPLAYIAPAFEEGTIRDFREVDGAIHTWHEHESPYRLLLDMLAGMGIAADASIGLCPSMAFFMYDGIRRLGSAFGFVDAACIINPCSFHKSATELALMQRAKDMTLEVHKAAASILREGISTTEVAEFIHQAHRRVGAPGSTFCIVLFGEASAFPHGVKHAQVLKDGDMVLIDTGCQLHGYQSDITRSYVFGAPNERPCGRLRKPIATISPELAVFGPSSTATATCAGGTWRGAIGNGWRSRWRSSKKPSSRCGIKAASAWNIGYMLPPSLLRKSRMRPQGR